MSEIYVQPADRSWTVTKVVAAVRDVPHWFVFWINLLLGWTIIGWIVALIMSLRAQRLNVIS